MLALAGTEGLAYWWMHPAPAGLGQPVLVYRPGDGKELSVVSDPLSEKKSLRTEPGLPPAITDNRQPTSDNSSSTDIRQPTTDNSSASSLSSANSQPPTDHSSPTSSIDHRSSIISHSSSPSSSSPLSTFPISAFPQATPLPEVYHQAAPMLRCTGGQVFHVQVDDAIGMHGAFFEWDGTDTGSVLEAFRHMPEACMGSIGMKLVSKEKPRSYVVGLDRRGTEDRLSVVGGQLSVEETPDSESPRHASLSSSSPDNRQRTTDNSSSSSTLSSSSTDNRQRTTDNSSTTLSSTDNRQRTTDNSSSSSSTTLLFDHTIFREPGQGRGLVSSPPVHAFRAVWVSGMERSDAREGIGGDEFDRLRAIRLKSAMSRFRPVHARVIQGAVRGAANGDAAWRAFQSAMLADLKFQ